jgi:hypothetical protein
MKKINMDSQFFGPDFNPGPPEHQAGLLTT